MYILLCTFMVKMALILFNMSSNSVVNSLNVFAMRYKFLEYLCHWAHMSSNWCTV